MKRYVTWYNGCDERLMAQKLHIIWDLPIRFKRLESNKYKRKENPVAIGTFTKICDDISNYVYPVNGYEIGLFSMQ